MKEIYFMRHGEAESMARGGDSERTLTDNGVNIVTQVAQTLKALGCAPRRIFHSPFERTTQTAGIISEVLAVSDLVEEYALIPRGDPKMAASFIFADKTPSLFVVSHMPILPSMLKIFLGATLDFATADVARIMVGGGDRADGTGILRALMPHQLMVKAAASGAK